MNEAKGPTVTPDNVTLSSPGPPKQESEKVVTKPEQPNEPLGLSAPPNPRLQALAAKKANLDSTLATLQAQRFALVAEAKLPSGLAMPNTWTEEEKTKSALATANGVIKGHITLLHKYNEIKDIGQGLMGMIADKRGVRVATVMEDFDMDEKD